MLVLLFLCCSALALVKYAPGLLASVFVQIGHGTVLFPIGASYFFFRLTDLLLTWHRGDETERGFREYLCYMTFLPTIPAGPIETMQGFYERRLPRLDARLLAEAVGRILLGIAKKHWVVSVLLSHFLLAPGSGLLDRVTNDPAQVPYGAVVAFAICSLLYAYVDLSAYSDIAIGAGLLLGHRIRENFAAPLFSPRA